MCKVELPCQLMYRTLYNVRRKPLSGVEWLYLRQGPVQSMAQDQSVPCSVQAPVGGRAALLCCVQTPCVVRGTMHRAPYKSRLR